MLLDRTSAISAPNLLRKLQRLRDCGLLANLRILGVVANNAKFYGGKLVKDQAAVWDEIRAPCREAWGEKIHFFSTTIKHSTAVGEAAERHDQQQTTGTFAAFHDDLKPFFTDLTKEIEERIAHERSRLAAVPA